MTGPPPTCELPLDETGLVSVPRNQLARALDLVTVAYENAVGAAEAGTLDFGPFDGLPEAMVILRGTLQRGSPS